MIGNQMTTNPYSARSPIIGNSNKKGVTYAD